MEVGKIKPKPYRTRIAAPAFTNLIKMDGEIRQLDGDEEPGDGLVGGRVFQMKAGAGLKPLTMIFLRFMATL